LSNDSKPKLLRVIRRHNTSPVRRFGVEKFHSQKQKECGKTEAFFLISGIFYSLGRSRFSKPHKRIFAQHFITLITLANKEKNA